MRISIHRACLVAVAIATCCPFAFPDVRMQRRTVSGARFRVGLMFASRSDRSEESGLRISDVVPDGAAARAGLKAADVITHINGKECAGEASEFAGVFGAPEPIEFQVLRDGKAFSVTFVPEKVGGADGVASSRPTTHTPGRAGDRVRIPMGMDHGKPSVLANINGEGPFMFLVDTGASVTIINRELVKKLGLPIVGTQQLGDPSDPEAIKADSVHIDSITVGTTQFRDVQVASWDRTELYRTGEHPSGVLGIGLFKDFLLTFDYPAGEIAIDQGELPPVDNKEILSYTIQFGAIPTIRLSVAGKTMDAHFDTGSPAALSLPSPWEHRLQLKSPATVMGRARTVNSEFEIRGAQVKGDLVIGSHVFHDPHVIFAAVLDEIDAANIGSRLLSDFVLTFDQKNRRLQLRRP